MSEITITAKDIKDATPKNYQEIEDVAWNGLNLKIKRYLSLHEILQFADGVVRSCFITDTGEYIPEVKDFSLRCAMLAYYTNIELPEDLESKHDLVYASDIVSCVMRHIDGAQFDALCEAINRKIHHTARSKIEAITKQINEISAEFNALGEKISQIFSGIDGDTIAKLAGAITDDSFDVNKLAQAFSKNMPRNDNVAETLKR